MQNVERIDVFLQKIT